MFTALAEKAKVAIRAAAMAQTATEAARRSMAAVPRSMAAVPSAMAAAPRRAAVAGKKIRAGFARFKSNLIASWRSLSGCNHINSELAAGAIGWKC